MDSLEDQIIELAVSEKVMDIAIEEGGGYDSETHQKIVRFGKKLLREFGLYKQPIDNEVVKAERRGKMIALTEVEEALEEKMVREFNPPMLIIFETAMRCVKKVRNRII